MTDINNLFFEGQCKREQSQARLSSAECSLTSIFYQLVRVAIGTQESLSQLPSACEWDELYKMAKEQSLVRVCFAGLQRLGADADEGFARIGMREMLYMTWMGLAAKIMQRNRIEDEQCVALQRRLTADGMRSCILKGQGVTSIYGEHLHGLRQPGDIDVWVQDKSIEELVEYVKKFGVRYKATAAHVECGLFKGTDVELHAVPAFMRCFWHDKRLREWFDENSIQITLVSNMNVNVPTIEFNLVYMMVHMYHHVLFEGLGLRQLMDYYFVLKAYANEKHHVSPTDYSVNSIFKNFGMLKFAQGIIWVIEYVFNGSSHLSPLTSHLSIEANEKYGWLILEDVMTGGNFGHHDEKNNDLHDGTEVGRSLSGLKRNMKFFALGPWEVLCSPLWSTRHHWWRKRYGLL